MDGLAPRLELSPLEEVLQLIRSGASAALQFSPEMTVQNSAVSAGLEGSGIRLLCAGKPHDLASFTEQVLKGAGVTESTGRDAAFDALTKPDPGHSATALLITDAHTLCSETTLQFIVQAMLAQPKMSVVMIGRAGLREVLQRNELAPVRTRFTRRNAIDRATAQSVGQHMQAPARAIPKWLVLSTAIVTGAIATVALGVTIGLFPSPWVTRPAQAPSSAPPSQRLAVTPAVPKLSNANRPAQHDPLTTMASTAVQTAQPASPPLSQAAIARPLPPTPPQVADLQTIALPGGTFHMGSQDDRSELPVHTVTVPPFALSSHAVEVGAWSACVTAGKCLPVEGAPNAPVTNVSWDDAEHYAAWLSETTGHLYRLPTEAEWEYAARAGSTFRYAWGNDLAAGKAACATCGNANHLREAPGVEAFPPNKFGLFGMGGGVAEWVEDCWHKNYAGAPSDASVPWETPGCANRVLRGGSWTSEAADIRPASRDSYDASVRYPTHGFRLVREDGAGSNTPFQ